MAQERIFDESTLRKLEQLTLIATKVRVGVMKGERRSSKRGTSIEFADYRNYVHGDDLRQLDWNVYARLEKPFIKLLEEEEDLTVHILLDASESMNWPREEGFLELPFERPIEDFHKFVYGQKLSAALAHIGLSSGDRINVALLGDSRVLDRYGPARGRGRTMQLLSWLERLSTRGQTDLNQALADYGLRGGRAGLAILISDMLSPEGYEDGLNALLGRGYEVVIIHLLSPDEIDPQLAGDLRLIDTETGAGQDVTIDGSLRDLYDRRLREWRDEMGSYCLSRDIHYVSVDTATPWESVILYALRRAGVVR